MSNEERQAALAERKGRGLPWHSPPHLEYVGFLTFIITAACYEHKPILGSTQERLLQCEAEIADICTELKSRLFAWCVLPNHYHFLVRTDRIREMRKAIGRFHGRTSRQWNIEDNVPGRKIWHNFFERPMRSNRHFWASVNYIHHNPVHHGHADRWQDWTFSSAAAFIEAHGRAATEKIWREYPVLDYGKKWDLY